ncbi:MULTISPECIES: hypothetical protein [Comamonadaceae]|uniref:COG3904 family protein n=1 Tax=Comamonadaceae TaxID=80864 RepID=UPI0011A0A17F|nr:MULTISPECIES: hypothetical protein [Comamonadaceae]
MHVTLRLPKLAGRARLSPKFNSWPGMGQFFRLHWRGELGLFRTLVVALCVVFVPTTLILFGAFLLSQAFHPESKPVDMIFRLGSAALLPAMFWWAVGTYRKSMNLLTESRTAAAFLTFLMAGFGIWMLWGTAREVILYNWKSPSAYARFLSECEQRTSKWISKPWTVTAMPELNRIVVSGSIGEGSAKALERAILDNPHLKLLQLDSSGGLVHEEELMIEIVRKQGLDTLVQGRCVSACTGIFLAGERRFITPDARFGFHRAGYCGLPRGAPWGISDYMTSIYYRERGVEEGFMQEAMKTEYHDLWRPSALEVKLGKFATHWWSERPEEYSRAAFMK